MADVQIREGFLCPMCMQDLGTVTQLTEHFEEEHANEDGDVINQLKGLFNKAKKKILKEDRDEEVGAVPYVSDKPISNAAKVSGIDPTLWEPQRLGASRSHIDVFKRIRDTRIDRFVIETNKLLIRLDKLLGSDVPHDPGKRKAYEKTVVPWTQDSDVQICPTCTKRFNVTRRRHHCRLCGGIMCNKCSHFMPSEYAKKLTNPSFQYEGGGFHRSSSNSSLNSMFTPEGDLHIRTCDTCRTYLERRDQQMEQRNATPVVVQLYEKLKKTIEETDRLLPYFLKMTESLNSGETSYSLEDAQMLRMKVMKLYETLDTVSKRILNYGLDSTESPSQKQLKLQRMIRVYASGYLQDNLMGLQSLPTAEEFEKIKEQRKKQIQQKIEMEKLAAAERARQREQRPIVYEGNSSSNHSSLEEKFGHRHQDSKGFVQDQGWKPSEIIHNDEDDPMVQQMNNIKGYIKQAKEADRWDEAHMFEENLRDLQQEYWKQHKSSSSTHGGEDRMQSQRTVYNRSDSGYVSLRDQQHQQQTMSHNSASHMIKTSPIKTETKPIAASSPLSSLPNRLLEKVKPKQKSLNPFDEDYGEDGENEQQQSGSTLSSNKSTNPFED